MLIISQIVIFMILLGLGFYVFKKYHFQLTSSHMTICALMIAVSTVLQLFSLTIPLFGFPSLKVGFGQLPIMVLGIVFNPAYAFFVGIVKDVVGLIVAPSGTPYLGFTLNTVLVGVIPALCYHGLHKQEAKSLKKIVIAALLILLGLSAFFIVRPELLGLDAFGWEMKGVLVLILVAIGIVLGRIIVVGEDNLFMIYALSVFLVEVIVNFTSTPIYLNIMYGIPVSLNVMLRLFKAGFMYPITVLVGYYVLRVLLRLQKNATFPKEHGEKAK